MKTHKQINKKPIRFGVVSDTHLCAFSEALNELNQMYDIFKKEGIEYVFNAGDITDGIGVYPGHDQEIKVGGVERQAHYVIKNYPERKGIKTVFITGNHDLKQFNKNGIDVGGLITHGGVIPSESTETKNFKGRDDLEYLGQYYARVNWSDCLIDLVHPDCGFAYAISYAPQKYINELEGGSKPDILLFGHLHRAMFMNYRNINLFMAGCFQKQNNFLKRKGIMPVRGGWIIEARKHAEKGSQIDVKSQFYKYY